MRNRYTMTESDRGVVLNPSMPADATVIWLHGLGASGHDFVPIVPELDLPEASAIRFVFPHAPVRPVTLNGGMPMRAWYDILSLTRTGLQDEPGVRQSATQVDALIAEAAASGIARSRMVLAGFSQGGAIVLHAGIRQPQPLAGVMALSTYLPLHTHAAAEITEGGRATPILMCHGRQDMTLSLELGTTSRDGLRALGCTVEWREYAMGHQVCAEEIEDISAWLRQRLPIVA
jgi:phospholipase/carboxylesterase